MKLIDMRFVDIAAVAMIPVVFFTDLILFIGRRVGLNSLHPSADIYSSLKQ